MSARSVSLVLSVFLLLPVLPATAAGLDDADERLFRVQLAMAEEGNTRAQYHLGEMHELGLGTPPNAEEAFKWYTRAAEQGDPLAKRKLALRQEITSEIRKEQEIGKLVSPAPAAQPGKPAGTKKNAAPTAVTQADQARQEQERRMAAEREKRRAMVRAMVMERMRNPVGGMFE